MSAQVWGQCYYEPAPEMAAPTLKALHVLRHEARLAV